MLSGVGVMKKSKNYTERFLKYLISTETQKGLSIANFEYPIDIKNAGNDVSQYGKFQGLKLKDLQIRKNKQNELFDLRKKFFIPDYVSEIFYSSHNPFLKSTEYEIHIIYPENDKFKYEVLLLYVEWSDNGYQYKTMNDLKRMIIRDFPDYLV